jgi:hypothetical protein
VVLERFDPGSDLTITLELDVEPTPKLKATKGLKAEAESVSYDPARVDELIEQSRKQLATLVPVEGRAAQAADVAVLSFSGIFADTQEPITGGSSDAMEVELEEGRMIPGFVEAKPLIANSPRATPRRTPPAAKPVLRSASKTSKPANCLPSTTPSPSRPATSKPSLSCGQIWKPVSRRTASAGARPTATTPCSQPWSKNSRWSCPKRWCSKKSAT